MVLIRPLILTNIEREYKVHTILFFIFCTCNCGGLLLPIGDPPLFLGYLRGVPFLWTTGLWPYWLLVNSILLAVYFAWDWIVYRKEALRDLMRDEQQVQPLRLHGTHNLLWLLGVVLSVALILPGQPFLNTGFHPPVYFREAAMLLFVVLSLLSTNVNIRLRNRFDYVAITEVAALFSGIFICMQVPIEILQVRGSHLGIDTPFEFFWFTGVLSSVLDNAPTYVRLLRDRCLTPGRGGLFFATTSRGKAHYGEPVGGDQPGGGLHGSRHLHRKRSQFHGEEYRRAIGHSNAFLLWVHGLQRLDSDSRFCACVATDLALVDCNT